MSDILQRLRCTVPCQDMTAKAGCHCAEARDEITRLTARVEELEAIAHSVAAIDLDSGTEHDEALMILAIEQARAAITKEESNG